MFTRTRCPAVLLLATLLLAACTTPSERQLQKVSAGTEDLWIQYDACMAGVEATAAYQRLERAFILRRDDPHTVEKMAVERFATDEEKTDLLQNQKITSRCTEELFTGFAEVNPGFNVLLTRFTSEDEELVLRTIQDEVTIAERNRVVHQRFAKRLSDWNFAGERIVKLYSWRSRRTCSVYYCSSSHLASLLPTSTDRKRNATGGSPSQARDLAVRRPKTWAGPPAWKQYTGRSAKTAGAEFAPSPPEAETPEALAEQSVQQTLELSTQRTGARPASFRDLAIGLAAAAGPSESGDEPKKARVAQATALAAVRPKYTVHIASMRSEVEARAAWGELQARYPEILADRVFFTRALRPSGQGSFVRILTGLYSNRDEARDLCRQLNGKEQYCAVVKLPERDG